MPDGTQVRFPDEMPKEQIRDMIASKFPEVAPKTEAKPAVSQMPKVDVPQYSGWEIAGDAAKGFGKGVGVGLERVLSGLTLGGYDWASDKLGLGAKERVKELKEAGGTPMKVALGGTEFVGGMLPITKGAKVLKGVGGMALTGAGAGALSSGFASDFDPTQMAVGGTIGGVSGGTLGLVGKGISKAFGKRSAVKGVKRGLENAVESDKGTGILSTAVGTNKKIANEVLEQAPEALEEINARASRTLQKGLGKGVDVSDEMAKAKQAYADFIDKNKNRSVFNTVYEFNPKDGNYIPTIKSIRRNLKKTNPELKMPIKDGKIDYEHILQDGNRSQYIQTLPSTYKNPDSINVSDGKYSVVRRYYNPTTNKDVGDVLTLNNENVLLSKLARDTKRGVKYIDKIGAAGRNTSTPALLSSSNGGITSPDNLGNIIQQNLQNVKKKVPESLLKNLTEQQQEWLSGAWNAGKKNTTAGFGTLGHLDETSKQLNSMIQKSRVANPAGVGTVATPDTVALQGIKDKLDDIITNAGLKDVKNQYARAKGLQNAYDMGLKFNPNDAKMRNLDFNPDERSAFAQGLVEKIRMNPESKNIAGNVKSVKGALRKVLGENADATLKELESLDKSYGRIVNLGRKAMTKTGREDTTGLFLREQIESKGSARGAILDYLKGALSGNKARGASEYLLNPAKRLRPSRYERVVKPTLMEILSIETPKLNRAIQGEE